MDIEELWETLHKERSTASLQELPSNFCEEVRAYIKKLQEERRESNERRSGLVEDEIRNIRMKVEDIIRRRIGKIVKLASSGIKTPPKGMLGEEEKIFEAVKSQVERGKEQIFTLMLGEEDEGAEDNKGEDKSEDKSEKKVKGTRKRKIKSSKVSPLSTKAGNEELHIVRVLDEIPTFMGTDGRIYKIKKEDVIMLPKTNAEILCERGVAVRFGGKAKKKEVVMEQ
jgi:DNA replication factor GINS